MQTSLFSRSPNIYFRSYLSCLLWIFEGRQLFFVVVEWRNFHSTHFSIWIFSLTEDGSNTLMVKQLFICISSAADWLFTCCLSSVISKLSMHWRQSLFYDVFDKGCCLWKLRQQNTRLVWKMNLIINLFCIILFAYIAKTSAASPGRIRKSFYSSQDLKRKWSTAAAENKSELSSILFPPTRYGKKIEATGCVHSHLPCLFLLPPPRWFTCFAHWAHRKIWWCYRTLNANYCMRTLMGYRRECSREWWCSLLYWKCIQRHISCKYQEVNNICCILTCVLDESNILEKRNNKNFQLRTWLWALRLIFFAA